MTTLIDKINANLEKSGLERRSAEARSWLTDQVKNLRTPSPKKILGDTSKSVTKIVPGKMYFYNYDPKGKDTLSYYDRFPLVLPIELYSDGWLGLNLHYIQPRQRLMLLDKLYSTLNNKKFDSTTKMRLSYNMLNGASRFKEFQPCLKRYLSSHVQSRLIEIESSEWEVAAVIPFGMFGGVSRNKVYQDSKEIIDGV
ncbi:DNA end protector protein [uncultured Caudovirales phage]|uniref:DNA end protector protein n=1 Tax=uncultured Caudovirales phage TaxID=2100421 RepID=A0A6J5KNY6_9CAUD|nr:DNA end protector protein [uncultured Caudovirales phage]